MHFNINDREQMAQAGTDAAMQFARYVTGIVDGAPAQATHAYLQSVFGTLLGLSVASIGKERTLEILHKMVLLADEIADGTKKTQH